MQALFYFYYTIYRFYYTIYYTIFMPKYAKMCYVMPISILRQKTLDIPKITYLRGFTAFLWASRTGHTASPDIHNNSPSSYTGCLHVISR